MKIKIENRQIGDDYPCFIIAEAGSNHNGSLESAKQLIDIAAGADADAVKFQVFRAHRLYPKTAGISHYLKTGKSIYDIIAEMEMPYDWLPVLAEYSNKKGLFFMASAFDEESLESLDPFVRAHKIASYEMTHLPLVQAVAEKRKPVLISTGTANLEEVAETVQAFRETKNPELALFQCTAAYPAPLNAINARAIPLMKAAFQVPTGLSDHSRDPIIAPVTAVACGANLIEKHFTLSNDLPGPDHRFAVEPDELRLMVRKIREAEETLGSGEKLMQPIESELRLFARRSIFATKPIAAGQPLTKDNIAVLRCGNLEAGLPPRYFRELLGRKARRHIAAESAVRIDDYV